jgi:hypothetical protein
VFRITDRQRAEVTAIVDTFASGVDGLPPCSEHGVEVIEAVASNPRKAERRRAARGSVAGYPFTTQTPVNSR